MNPLLHRLRLAHSSKNEVARPLLGSIPLNPRGGMILLLVVICSNMLTHSFFNPGMFFAKSAAEATSASPALYLIDEASMHITEPERFEEKVKTIAAMLRVAPEWLMAIMYSESKFQSAVYNYKGSGAVGLIQFMPTTAREMNTTSAALSRLHPVDQLDYVYRYLQTVRERYGDFNSLTDLYLAVLYPKALGQDYCYTLYDAPTQAYKQNSGLDEDKDGRVTVSDIDKRMKRIFPPAYMATK